MGNGAIIQLREMREVESTIKYPKLIIKKGNKTYYYRCDSAVWNYYLGRFYPKADQIMISETLNHNR